LVCADARTRQRLPSPVPCSSCRSFASDSLLAVPGADVTYDGRCVGRVVNAHVDTGLEFLLHDPAGCEHYDAARR